MDVWVTRACNAAAAVSVFDGWRSVVAAARAAGYSVLGRVAAGGGGHYGYRAVGQGVESGLDDVAVL